MNNIYYLALLLMFGCSSSPTKYTESAASKKEGYADRTIEGDLREATFLGNSATPPEKAELYAKFRAVEVCSELNAPYTHIFLVKDKSFEKQVTSTTADYPNYYYYGAAPFYGRGGAYHTYYSGAGSVRTTSETYEYPLFEVYFECSQKPYGVRFSTRNLSQSHMKELVKDLKGAVQIDEVLPDSPNINNLKSGDIITRVNGNRIENLLEFYRAYKTGEKDHFPIEFFRDGKLMKGVVKLNDVTEMVAQSQQEIIKAACTEKDIKDTREICKR